MRTWTTVVTLLAGSENETSSPSGGQRLLRGLKRWGLRLRTVILSFVG